MIAGVDEAGRGPLAGPVIAAAVILDPSRRIDGLADSKTLAPARRRQLAQQIEERAIACALGRADHLEIDSLNILNAALLAMERAVNALSRTPTKILVDGIHCPRADCPVTAIPRGDQSEACISAASILAKVARDREMEEQERIYPGYGFFRHKGYPTRQHLEALAALGPCPIHRRSFAPVRRCAQQPTRAPRRSPGGAQA